MTVCTTSVVTSMLCSKVHALRSGTAKPTGPRVVLSTHDLMQNDEGRIVSKVKSKSRKVAEEPRKILAAKGQWQVWSTHRQKRRYERQVSKKGKKGKKGKTMKA